MSLFTKLFGKKQNDIVVRYYPFGVKVQFTEFSVEDLESCFDFVKKLQPKVYTKDEINFISSKLGFDCEEYYVFIPEKMLVDKWTSIESRMLYLWKDVDPKAQCSDELCQKMKSILSKKGFLSRADIENISRDIGCSVYDKNKWKQYYINQYKFPNGQSCSVVEDPRDNHQLRK